MEQAILYGKEMHLIAQKVVMRSLCDIACLDLKVLLHVVETLLAIV